MPFGYVDWKKNCSMIRSSCCGWRIRNPNRRSSGNRLRAGADCWNIPPSLHKNSCGRLRRWFRACSDRNRSYTPGSRFACKWHHFHSPEPMYDCRNPGKCLNRRHRSRGSWWYTILNTGRNDSYCIHCSLRDRVRNARRQRMCPEKSTFRKRGSCQ